MPHPNTSVGLTNSVIHTCTCSYERSNVYTQYISIQPHKHHLEAINIGVHVPRWHEGFYPCEAIGLRPSHSSSHLY
jgi:hypothetical protein